MSKFRKCSASSAGYQIWTNSMILHSDSPRQLAVMGTLQKADEKVGDDLEAQSQT